MLRRGFKWLREIDEERSSRFELSLEDDRSIARQEDSVNVRFPNHPSKCGIRRARARFRVGKGEHPAHDPQSGVRHSFGQTAARHAIDMCRGMSRPPLMYNSRFGTEKP